MLRRRLITVAVLLVAGGTALLAIPGLHGAARRASSINPLWLVGAVALELASCVSFLPIFRRFFAELPASSARRLAWIEMGSRALLPGGGVGSLAAGALLLRRSGMPTRRIVEKSSGLFFLTSGTNVVALVGAAALLELGIGSGRRGFVAPASRRSWGCWGCHPRRDSPHPVAPSRAQPCASPHRRWHHRGRTRAATTPLAAARRPRLPRLRYRGAGPHVRRGRSPDRGPRARPRLHHGYAGNALPVPGGIGVLAGGLVGALVLYGAPVVPATAAVLIYHTISFWIPSFGGAIAYFLVTVTGKARLRPAAEARACEARVRLPQAARPTSRPTPAEAA